MPCLCIQVGCVQFVFVFANDKENQQILTFKGTLYDLTIINKKKQWPIKG